MDPIGTGGLPPILAQLLAPWLDAIEASEPGMGDHVMAVAAHCSDTVRRRIELTPALEGVFADTLAATDTLATALDMRRVVPPWVRKAAREAMIDLIAALRGAEPNAVTKELGLGW